jgi:hypothetical protein
MAPCGGVVKNAIATPVVGFPCPFQWHPEAVLINMEHFGGGATLGVSFPASLQVASEALALNKTPFGGVATLGVGFPSCPMAPRGSSPLNMASCGGEIAKNGVATLAVGFPTSFSESRGSLLIWRLLAASQRSVSIFPDHFQWHLEAHGQLVSVC